VGRKARYAVISRYFQLYGGRGVRLLAELNQKTLFRTRCFDGTKERMTASIVQGTFRHIFPMSAFRTVRPGQIPGSLWLTLVRLTIGKRSNIPL
jgi:hypothetical protein